MPILRVRHVGADIPGLARRLASACSLVLAARPGSTWVFVSRTEPRDYAENDEGLPSAGHPMLVSVLLGELPERQARADLATRLATAVAGSAPWPLENVHVLFEPAAAGRIAFGGVLED